MAAQIERLNYENDNQKLKDIVQAIADTNKIALDKILEYAFIKDRISSLALCTYVGERIFRAIEEIKHAYDFKLS